MILLPYATSQIVIWLKKLKLLVQFFINVHYRLFFIGVVNTKDRVSFCCVYVDEYFFVTEFYVRMKMNINSCYFRYTMTIISYYYH